MIKTPHLKKIQTLKEFLLSIFSLFRFNLPVIKGFTLIELLVVVTLVGMVSGIGIFSLISYGNTQTIEQALGNVRGIFDEAKFNALSSVKLSDCQGDLVSYVVDIEPSSADGSPDTIDLIMNCESSTDTIKSYNLPSNTNFGVGTSCDYVTYESVELNSSAFPSLPCFVTIEGFDITKTIRIDALGNVNIEN